MSRNLASHPDLVHLRRLPESELRERCQTLLENLGYWLAPGNEEELAKAQELVGKRPQGIPKDSLGLYAEEEMEYRIGGFFDTLIVRTVRGYQAASHKAAHAAA